MFKKLVNDIRKLDMTRTHTVRVSGNLSYKGLILDESISVDSNVTRDELKYNDAQMFETGLHSLSSYGFFSLIVNLQSDDEDELYDELVFHNHDTCRQFMKTYTLDKDTDSFLSRNNLKQEDLWFVLEVSKNSINVNTDLDDNTIKILSYCKPAYDTYCELLSLIDKQPDFDRTPVKPVKTDVSLLKETINTIEQKNTFDRFLKGVIELVSTETYLYTDKSKAQLVFEHVGYDFQWNSYPYDELKSLKGIPTIHSYEDLSWKVARCNTNRNDLTGLGIRNLVESNSTYVSDLLYEYTNDAILDKHNVFSDRSNVFKVSLTEGPIVTIQKEWDGMYGLSSNGKVIMTLKHDRDLEIDKNKFKKGLNRLITDVNLSKQNSVTSTVSR